MTPLTPATNNVGKEPASIQTRPSAANSLRRYTAPVIFVPCALSAIPLRGTSLAAGFCNLVSSPDLGGV